MLGIVDFGCYTQEIPSRCIDMTSIDDCGSLLMATTYFYPFAAWYPEQVQLVRTMLRFIIM